MQYKIQQHTFGVFISIPLEVNADTIATLVGVPAKVNLNHPLQNIVIERSSAVVGDDVVVDLAQKVVRFKPQEGDFDQVGTWMYQVFFENSSLLIPSAQGSFLVLANNQR